MGTGRACKARQGWQVNLNLNLNPNIRPFYGKKPKKYEKYKGHLASDNTNPCITPV